MRILPIKSYLIPLMLSWLCGRKWEGDVFRGEKSRGRDPPFPYVLLYGKKEFKGRKEGWKFVTLKWCSMSTVTQDGT